MSLRAFATAREGANSRSAWERRWKAMAASSNHSGHGASNLSGDAACNRATCCGHMSSVECAALVAEESVGNVVFAPDKSVALLGVEGLILVSTDDAILVASKDKAQSVRDLHAKLGKLGWDDLL